MQGAGGILLLEVILFPYLCDESRRYLPHCEKCSSKLGIFRLLITIFAARSVILYHEQIKDNKIMKKFVYCISLLLAALCTTAMAQETDNLLKIAGVAPQAGSTTYYLKNVGTGLYISYGGEHGVHCVETRAAHPIVLTNNTDGTVAIGSIVGYLNSGDTWMDQSQTNSKWTLEPVEGYTNQYYLQGNGGKVLTSVGNSAGLLYLKELEKNASQRWAFLTESDIRSNKMPQATAEEPFDVTPFIKGASFDLADLHGSNYWSKKSETPSAISGLPYANNWTNFIGNIALEDGDDIWDDKYCIRTNVAEDYNFCGIIDGTSSALTITYKVTLPAGTYSYSFEGFYEYLKMVTEQYYSLGFASGDPTITISENGTMDVKVTVAGIQHTLKSYGDKAIYDDSRTAAAIFRDNEDYGHQYSGTFYLSKEQEVSITITKPATTGNSESGGKFFSTLTTTSYPSQIFVDDFTLLYFGPKNESNVSESNLFKSYLNAYIEEYIEKLPEDEREYAREAMGTLNLDNITSIKEFYNAIEGLTEKIEEIKWKKLKDETLNGLTTDGDGYVYRNGVRVEDALVALPNVVMYPSFETDVINGSGWRIGKSTPLTNIQKNEDTYATQNCDGDKLFYSEEANGGTRLTQTITGLPNGIYKVTASLASNKGNTIYLIGNNQRRGVTMTNDAATFEDHYIKFRVSDGTATIGVVGGDTDADHGDTWYKCDNFRLEIFNGDHLELDQAATTLPEADYWYGKLTLGREIKTGGKWNTFVVPFDIPASSLSEWEVKELTGSTSEDDIITLIFSDVEDGIKAGVPYMVRNKNGDGLKEINMNDVNVTTTLTDIETDHVTFKGVYTYSNVPVGSYFISSNNFYRCVNADNPDKVKGYRGYITPKESSNARSLGYRFASKEENEEGTTAIEEQTSEEATVVAIYTLGGVRIDDMQQGVNILQMSDGSIVKVIIK